MRHLTCLALSISVLLLSACSHTMEIINLPDRPFASTVLDSPLAIGVVNRGGREAEGYVEAVARALTINGNVERVAYPYVEGQRVDAIAYVDVQPKYKGSWVNFFVDWPGFLIWTPAWHGYNYRADIDTKVEIRSASNQAILSNIEWRYEFRFRQADIGRSWIEVGWLEVSFLPFIGGFFAISYDADQTPEFIRRVETTYGNQIATRMIREVRSAGDN